jgi:hypothetical protein
MLFCRPSHEAPALTIEIRGGSPVPRRRERPGLTWLQFRERTAQRACGRPNSYHFGSAVSDRYAFAPASRYRAREPQGQCQTQRESNPEKPGDSPARRSRLPQRRGYGRLTHLSLLNRGIIMACQYRRYRIEGGVCQFTNGASASVHTKFGNKAAGLASPRSTGFEQSAN